MKLFRCFAIMAVVVLSSTSIFAQKNEDANEDAKEALLKWKLKNAAAVGGNFQGAGFSVGNAEKGVVAKFYLEYGQNVSGLRATQFIAQPVTVTRTDDGKSLTADVGKPFRIRWDGLMLAQGSGEDRIATPQITFFMPPGANAVRLTVEKMFGENGPAQIILGINAHGVVSNTN